MRTGHVTKHCWILTRTFTPSLRTRSAITAQARTFTRREVKYLATLITDFPHSVAVVGAKQVNDLLGKKTEHETDNSTIRAAFDVGFCNPAEKLLVINMIEI